MAPKAAQCNEMPDTVDGFIALAVACGSDWQQLQANLLPALTQLEKKGVGKGATAKKWSQVLASNTAEGQDPLMVLNPQISSLLWMWILHARYTESAFATIQQYFDCVQNFGMAAQVQIYLSPHLIKALADGCVAWAGQTPGMAIPPLFSLIRATTMGVPPGTLTPVHRVFAYAVLQAHAFVPAYVAVFDTPMINIEPTFHPIDYKDHLLYHFYAGIIAGAAGRYDTAIELLELAVSAPTHSTPSAIQVDAYKKLVLLQFIHRGKASPLPRYTAASVASACKNLTAYADLAAAFTRLDRQKWKDVLDKHGEVIQKDGNVGLVHRCIDRWHAFQIRNMTNTYVTIELPELARRLDMPTTPEGLQQCAEELNHLQRNRDIFIAFTNPTGDLNQASIEFLDDPETYDTPATVTQLERVIQNVKSRTLITQDRDDAMASSVDFLKKALVAASSGGSGPANMFAGAGNFSAFDEGDIWDGDDEVPGSFFS